MHRNSFRCQWTVRWKLIGGPECLYEHHGPPMRAAVSYLSLSCSCHAREGVDLVLHVELGGSLGLGAVVGLQVAV